MVSHLGSGIAIVPIIAILGNVAIAKSFCKFKKRCQYSKFGF
jgi:hypothetical protein